MLRQKLLVVTGLIFTLFLTFTSAQDRGKVKKLTPTASGSTGLFRTPFAETLRPGEVSLGFHGSYLHREPGDMSLTVFPVSITAGVADGIEFFISYQVHKRVHAESTAPNQVAPGAPLRPTTLPGGTISYFNDTPFLDVGFGSGPGDFSLGVKLNILSERDGAPFSLAFQPSIEFDTGPSRGRLARGLSAGATDVGFDFIFSKNAPKGATFTFSSGLEFTGDPGNSDGFQVLNARLERQNEWNTGIGIDVPLGSSRKVHAIGELFTTVFFGDRFANANPRSPVDIFAGLRAYPSKWLTVGGGYAVNVADTLGTIGVASTDRNGWWGQVALHRKINEPPTISCSPATATIECTQQPCEGGSATINANVFDPDDDFLTVSWNASGGQVQGQDASATFNARGLNAGRYSIKGEVSDGEMVGSCVSDITVVKRKGGPTISCSPASQSLTLGGSTTLRSSTSDPNNDALTFAWTVNGSRVTNNQPDFEFGSTGRNPGRYAVKVTTTDVDGLSANCTFNVTVNRRPNNPPRVSLALNPTTVYACQNVNATATASDPDNDRLTLSWQLDGSGVSGSGATRTINTCGLAGGPHSVTVTATDDRGASANDTKSFSVIEKVIIQMPLDNIGKAKLDEIALKMQQTPRLKAVITGYTDDRGSDSANERVGTRRADGAKDYLVQQHSISADRIEIKSGGETNPVGDNTTAEGRKANRRVEVELSVP